EAERHISSGRRGTSAERCRVVGRRFLAVISLIVVGCSAACSGGSEPVTARPTKHSTVPPSTAQLVQDALRAAAAHGSVHYVQTTPLPHTRAGTSVGDVAMDHGLQRI